MIRTVALNPLGRDMAWQFFKDNKNIFIQRYGAGALICRMIKIVAENFSTETRAVEVEQFFRDNQFPGSELTVQQAVETIRLNAAILQRDATSLCAYLDELYPNN